LIPKEFKALTQYNPSLRVNDTRYNSHTLQPGADVCVCVCVDCCPVASLAMHSSNNTVD